MAQLGTAFQVSGVGNHLWIVISAPNTEGKVVCVNVTDANNYPDSSCHLRIGDHKFITKPSVIMYKGARLWGDAFIDARVVSGQLIQYEDFRPEIIDRIIQGAFSSDDIAPFLLAFIKHPLN